MARDAALYMRAGPQGVSMDFNNAPVTLFEVSWEVCNKVGGIYSVVSSKALQAVANMTGSM